MNKGVLLILIVLVALTACGRDAAPAQAPTPESAAPQVSTPTPAVAVTPAPVESAVPTVTPDRVVESPVAEEPKVLLPAPLYYLSGVNGLLQIFRMERDGERVTQLTEEPEGITMFHRSPVDNRLVYITGNDLVVAGAMGESPVVIYHLELPPGSESAYLIPHLMHPRWSPDGQRIAFGMFGVNLINPDGSQHEEVLPGTVSMDPNEIFQRGGKIYRPEAWSPDGRRLLVTIAWVPEGGNLGVLDLESGDLLSLEPSPTCCDAAWGHDGSEVYLAGSSYGLAEPGLFRYDAGDGAFQTIIPAKEDESDHAFNAFLAPSSSPDGHLYLLASPKPVTMLDSIAWLAPMRAPRGEVHLDTLQTLNEDSLPVIEAAWAPKHEGILIVSGEFGWQEMGGPLYYVPTDGSKAIDLMVTGRYPLFGR